MTSGARGGGVAAALRGLAASVWVAAAGPWTQLAVAADAAQPPQHEPAAQLSLTASQQQAVGIRIEQPLPLSSAPQREAYGTVLDPVALVTDLGRVESTRAAAAAAVAEAARLERLYRDDTQASLKALQAAQALSAEGAAQARAAALNFTLQWGPLADLNATQQRALVEALGQGQTLLLRAEVPEQLGGAIDRHAVVQLDGVTLSARVLGPLPRTAGPAPGAGWLLQLERAPPGLGPGARATVLLRAAATATGLLVPGEALVYAEQGAYVYRRQGTSGAGTFHYVAVAVTPLARVGSAWLVDGLAPGDQVVVQGAGVLWSLQGIGSFSAAEEEHD